MSQRSRILLIAMSSAFGMCVVGLVGGMVYTLYEALLRHQEQWSVLSASIIFYKVFGAWDRGNGALFCFFVFADE